MPTRKPRRKTPEQLEELGRKRAASLMTGSMRHSRKILDTHADPETGAGVVVLDWHGTRPVPTREAYFFKPRQTRQYFAREKIETDHQRIGVLSRLAALLQEMEDVKVRPHDLAVGDIMLDNWGHTMTDPRFYQVLGSPDPCTVEIVRIEEEIVSGDRLAGAVVPLEPYRPMAGHKPFTARVLMEDHSPRLLLGSLSRARRWDGKSASRTMD